MRREARWASFESDLLANDCFLCLGLGRAGGTDSSWATAVVVVADPGVSDDDGGEEGWRGDREELE